MSDHLKKCPACGGLGYFRCDCWPGDCICGQDEDTCWECDGEGLIDPTYDDDYPDDPEILDPLPPVGHVAGELLSALEDILPMAEDKWANPGEVSEIVRARKLLVQAGRAAATEAGHG